MEAKLSLLKTATLTNLRFMGHEIQMLVKQNVVRSVYVVQVRYVTPGGERALLIQVLGHSEAGAIRHAYCEAREFADFPKERLPFADRIDEEIKAIHFTPAPVVDAEYW